MPDILDVAMMIIICALGITLLYLVKCSIDIRNLTNEVEKMLLNEEEELLKLHNIIMSLNEESNKIDKITGVNTCVICGAIIPEGRQVCGKCEIELSGF